MNDYEINVQTLAIIPLKEGKSRVIEENNSYIVNKTPMKIIDNSCKFFGSSYEGRFSGTKTLTGITHKSPIIIEESRKMIFFPTKSPRLDSCIWISFNNILNYEQKENNSIIKFCCGKVLELDISYNIIDNQILRATRLESVLNKRMNELVKSI